MLVTEVEPNESTDFKSRRKTSLGTNVYPGFNRRGHIDAPAYVAETLPLDLPDNVVVWRGHVIRVILPGDSAAQTTVFQSKMPGSRFRARHKDESGARTEEKAEQGEKEEEERGDMEKGMGSSLADDCIRDSGSVEDGGCTTAARNIPIAPAQVDAAKVVYGRPTANFAARLAKILFFAHLVAVAILIIFLSIRGFLGRNPAFRPAHWFALLLSAALSSALVATLWLLFVLRHPANAIKASLWLAPSLACAVSVLLLIDGGSSSLAFAVLGLLLALVQSLYGCWIVRRLHHAYEILSSSIAAVQPTPMLAKYVALALLAGLVFSSIWILGAGGVAAGGGSQFAPLYVLLLLLSLGWTMQAIRYTVLVAVAQLAYLSLAFGTETAVPVAFEAAANGALGDVCYGSAVVPMVVAIRGTARAMGLIAGGSDEFLFSCASCYMGVADQLVVRGNRWGFVYARVHGKGLGNASAEVWELFIKQGMGRLIDMDITSSLCFLSGVTGGGVAALVAGSWATAAGKGHVTEVTVYAFIIGYFMVSSFIRLPLSPKCVSSQSCVTSTDSDCNGLASGVRGGLPCRLRREPAEPPHGLLHSCSVEGAAAIPTLTSPRIKSVLRGSQIS
ncbi:hypothetical protein BHM03_00016609 [Ensete ventricosum]|nr:hypothetical protein BHM03_00016609 [Ensete ventricosum]